MNLTFSTARGCVEETRRRHASLFTLGLHWRHTRRHQRHRPAGNDANSYRQYKLHRSFCESPVLFIACDMYENGFQSVSEVSYTKSWLSVWQQNVITGITYLLN